MANFPTNQADTIYDEIGEANIDALGGNDLIIAANEQAFDIINGGAGNDTISYVNLFGVTVDIGNVTQGYGYTVETWDLLTSIENVIGSSRADTLLGNAGNNELFGLAGDDFFEGRGGADKIDGGAGFDTATYQHAAVGVTVDLSIGKGFGGEASGDRLFNIERLIGSTHDDQLIGSNVRNTLEGGDGSDLLLGLDGIDTLIGGKGKDFLIGGRGGDILTGGAGADHFVFHATAESYALLGHKDVITDFNHSAGDKIDLSVIDAKAGTAANDAFHFIGASQFTAAGQIRAHVVGDHMVVEVNTSGSSGAEMVFDVAETVTLVEADFIL